LFKGTNSLRSSSFGACSDTASETVDHRHQAGGGQRDPFIGEAVTQVVAHHAHGAHDVVEIHQRLAHAHHHHIGELALFVRHVAQMPRRHPDLADDFGGGQIAVEALGGGGAELAVERAAHLRRHAQRAAAFVGNEHGFDRVLAVHAQQPLVGAVFGRFIELDLRHPHFGVGFQLAAQGFAQVRHVREFGDMTVMDPLHDLVRAVALLAEGLGEEALKPFAIELEQVLLRDRLRNRMRRVGMRLRSVRWRGLLFGGELGVGLDHNGITAGKVRWR
jgi:hypothetical protein